MVEYFMALYNLYMFTYPCKNIKRKKKEAERKGRIKIEGKLVVKKQKNTKGGKKKNGKRREMERKEIRITKE